VAPALSRGERSKGAEVTAASDDEIKQLRDSVHDFLARTLPSAAVRAAMDSGGMDLAAWRTLSESMGLTGIGIPERFGGAGYTFAELGVVLEEFGAALAPVPLLSTMVAAAAILAGERDKPRQALLPALASGQRVATVILGANLTASVAPAGGSWEVSGTARHVPDAAQAGLFVVAAAVDGRPEVTLLAVEAAAPGVAVRPLNGLDRTRQIAVVELAAAPAALLGSGQDLLDRVRATQLAAIACEQVGAAARCLEMIVDYAKTREQFGVPIGSFQAIKHRCADMLVELEAARSIAYRARDQLAEGVTDIATASAAASWCAEAYVHIAQETVQLHGGIGFTWEHDAHLHVRRARADQLLYGTPREHRRTLADRVGI
jgi:alkylation response protein AidB-like acyl-CoA dehydrogenase